MRIVFLIIGIALILLSLLNIYKKSKNLKYSLKLWSGFLIWSILCVLFGYSLTIQIMNISKFYNIYFLYFFGSLFGIVVYYRTYDWFIKKWKKIKI